MKYMGTYSLASVTKKVYDSGFTFFTLKTIRDILEVKKESTLFSILRRLIASEVLVKIEKDKYLLKNGKNDSFNLANNLYVPSYVSFESALNYFGILPQFPYSITSGTPKKSFRKEFADKIYEYVHIQKALFWGYEKINNYLIAFPEKAILDQLYISAKGIKSINWDEYDLANIDWKKFHKYLVAFPKSKQFNSIIKSFKSYLKL